MKGWLTALPGTLALATLGVLLWLPQFEAWKVHLWLIAIIAFFWVAVSISLLLRPREWRRTRVFNGTGPIVRSWSNSRNLFERFFPGASLPSGTYNRGRWKAWDENESLPAS
jgi:hypothetical protein